MSRQRVLRAALATLLGVPIGVLVVTAVSIRWTFPQVVPREFGLDLTRRVLGAPATAEAMRDGFAVSLSVTALSLLVAWPAARRLSRLTGWERAAVVAILFLPSLLPPVGLAMGVTVGLLRLGITGGFAAVLLAHLVQAIPYAVAMLTAALARHDPRLDQQAADLGAAPVHVLWRVTLPSVRGGVIAAAAFAFVVSWSQYLLTVLPGAGRVTTATVLLFAAASGGSPVTTATLALLVTLPVFVLVGAAGPAGLADRAGRRR